MKTRWFAPVLFAGSLAVLSTAPALAQDESAPALDQGRSTAPSRLFHVPRPLLSAPAVTDALPPRRDNGSSPEAVQFFVHNEDVSTVGSQCVGLDCTGTEAFGFDTIRLKENNLRIRFDDTSVAGGFPFKDWQLTANDSDNGGRNMFSIDNITDVRSPFTIMDSARNYSVFMTGLNVGFGTNAPVTSLHNLIGDTPTLRLDQDASVGWNPYTWDVAGNESNFFVRDVTGGSALTFRIMPGSGGNALVAAPAGVGLGTATPSARLHLVHSAPTMTVTNSSTATQTFQLDASGNLTLSGLIFESSSRDVKENLSPVDVDALLNQVSELPLYRWNYKSDDASTTHLGPVAEEVAEAFGLGRDEKHIAAMDASGVALGALKALAQRHREKEARIAVLEARLVQQSETLEQLTSELKALMERVEAK